MVWQAVTELGNPLLWGLAVSFLLLYAVATRDAKNDLFRKRIVFIATVYIAATFTSIALQEFLHVPRICEPCPAASCNPYCPSAYSFPSVHSAVSAAMGVSVALLFKRKALPMLAIPIVVCASRLFLGVHTIYDVLAGAAIGSLFPIVIWKWRNGIERFMERIV